MRYNLLLSIILSGCTYNELITGCTNPLAINYSADAIIDDGNCLLDECISTPSFVDCVKPIIDNNCVSCHSYGGESAFLVLIDYNSINYAVNNFDLVGIINTTMPKAALMPENNINIIEKWINDGAQNN